MDWAREFLEDLKGSGKATGNLLGVFNVLIGRRVEKADGTLVGTGQTWRGLAALLKKVRWEKDAVRELGLDPKDLPPRDREKFWYAAIAQARVDSPAATAAGNQLAEALRNAGYAIGPPPGT